MKFISITHRSQSQIEGLLPPPFHCQSDLYTSVPSPIGYIRPENLSSFNLSLTCVTLCMHIIFRMYLDLYSRTHLRELSKKVNTYRIVILILISKFLGRQSKAKRNRASAHSRALNYSLYAVLPRPCAQAISALCTEL